MNDEVKLFIDNIHYSIYNIAIMNISQKINMAIAYKGISQAALARSIGMTPQNFNNKFKRETFTQEELERIASALGGEFFFGFRFPDGTNI